MQMDLFERVVEQAIQIQAIPAPTFLERQRAAFVADQFIAAGLQTVHLDELGNVFACLPGDQSRSPLVVSAHLDSVFPADMDLTLNRQVDRLHGAGIGDNALGVAGLFGLVWALQHKSRALPGDVWLVANVAEEGLGDLKGMRAVVDRFGKQVLAYIILEGMALGQVYHRGLEVRRFQIYAHTAGGHAWVDFGKPSAIHELAALASRIIALPLPQRPRTSLNIGVITGGISVNSIASIARFELDLRSEGARAVDQLAQQVGNLVRLANRPGVEMVIESIGKRLGGEISASHPLVQLAKQCLESQSILPNLTIGSTDANIPLNLGYPAVCIGLTTGGGAHTQQEYINLPPLRQGLDQLVSLVCKAYEVL
jgi:acetylornithine deacetylase/succinyl-diaminopimelate desuccinylase-like protein